MRLSQIDLNLFIVFEAIYDKRNLTRAAELLCITQPAVSNALARMRKTFNDQLFVSTPLGMAPTPFSENIIGRIREALQLLNASAHENALFEPRTAKRVFRLSMTDLTEALLLPSLGEMIEQQAPGIRIESYFTSRAEIPTALTNGAIDLAIDAPLTDDPNLCRSLLLRDRYACMLRQDHPFTRDRLTTEDYLGFEHIHVSSRRRGSGHVDAELHKQGLRRVVRMRVQHYMVAPLIAMRTDLALTAPVRLLEHYDTRILELPFDVPHLEWYCYWHNSVDQDPVNRWLRDKLIHIVGNMQGINLQTQSGDDTLVTIV